MNGMDRIVCATSKRIWFFRYFGWLQVVLSKTKEQDAEAQTKYITKPKILKASRVRNTETQQKTYAIPSFSSTMQAIAHTHHVMRNRLRACLQMLSLDHALIYAYLEGSKQIYFVAGVQTKLWLSPKRTCGRVRLFFAANASTDGSTESGRIVAYNQSAKKVSKNSRTMSILPA